MSVTIDQIDATIFAALSQLTVPQGGLVRTLKRWVGDAPRGDTASEETYGKTPAILLAFEREAYVEAQSNRTLGAQYQFAAQSSWVALVCCSDPRGADRVAKGTANSIGAYALADQVIKAVNDIFVPSPVTVLSVQVQGTPNAVVTLDGATNTLVSPTGTAYVYTPAAQTVTLDSSGHGTVLAPLTAPAWTLGTISPMTTLSWSAVPANASATALNLGFATQGGNGLLWDKVIEYVDTRPVPGAMIPGRLFTLAVRFSATRAAPGWGGEDYSTKLNDIRGSVNSVDTLSDNPPNPISVFDAPVT